MATSIAPSECNRNVCPANICSIGMFPWGLYIGFCLLRHLNPTKTPASHLRFWADSLIFNTMSRANRPTNSDHLHRSKRRRTSADSPPIDDTFDRLVPLCNQSPFAASTAALREHIHPHHQNDASDEDSDAPSSQLLFTQPSHVSTQPSTALSPLPPTVKYRKAPPSIQRVNDIPEEQLSIIRDAVADLYPRARP
jgi:hypothetical protein